MEIAWSFSNLPTIYSKTRMSMKKETRKKISVAMKGKTKSTSHISKIAQSLRGKNKTMLHKKVISRGMKKYWEKRYEKGNDVPTCRGDKTCRFAHLIRK